MRVLYGAADRAGCCGLVELSGLFVENEELRSWDTPIKARLARGTAYFATTIPRETTVIAALKQLGFKPRVKWRNSNTTNQVTLWTYVPGQRRKKSKKVRRK